jgi:outer membrane receptor protein involved in Fe transport
MLKSIYKQFIMVVCLLCVSTLAFTQGTIKGTVKDASGEVVSFATLKVINMAAGAVADVDGNYMIANVPAGKVQVRASATGYATVVSDVEVMNGKVSQSDVAMGNDALGLTEVVVTGVANERSRLESSVSISSIAGPSISNIGARTTTEIFRSITGIRAEASGGEGNTNIGSRGAPISSGGSKYLQLQEDGLPVLLFGDMAFATADIFLRADNTINRIEAVRGGSASTMATNSPAGIINFISNTGAVQGGSIMTTLGLNFNQLRTDFNFGAPINESLSFNVGGFFRQGEGFRTAGYTANKGGQIKANVTKSFETGYARLSYKMLNDRTAAYMPMPMKVSGTNASPTWGSVDGYDALTGAMQSPYLLQNFGFDGQGGARNSNVADGMHPVSHSFGAEFNFNLPGGWKIEDRARYSMNSGRFVAPFPAEAGKAGDLAKATAALILPAASNAADSIARAALVAASVAQYSDGSAINADKLAARIHMFDTELDNFDNMMNDLKISKRFGKVNATLGYFTAVQNVNMSWLWNSYIMELNGDGSRPLNIVSGSLNFSQNGQYAYGVPAWGNCCQRSYNTQNTISAPYLNLGAEITEQLNFDGSVRFDFGDVSGTYASNTVSARDINGDGSITGPEASVAVIDNAKASPVNYKYDYVSYSVGANYKVNDNMAIFARTSKGHAAKADRILFGGDINSIGGLTKQTNGETARPFDILTQHELGWKLNSKKGGIFITAFLADADESAGYEATTQKYISNNYKAVGLETEVAFNFGALDLRGGFTFTSAKIESKDDNDGNQPRRLSPFMFNIMPTYNINKKHSVGLSIYGNSAAYAQDNNELVMPGYAVMNLFANFSLANNLVFGVTGNNLLNALGVTESEEGSITENQDNIVRARPIYGRSFSTSLRYNF